MVRRFGLVFVGTPPVWGDLVRCVVFGVLVFSSWSCGFLGNSRLSDQVGKPHPVILIDIDTLRPDHLGCYGYHRDTSPTIDRLATEGLLFEWAFAQAPYTPPSQTSILTSLYPHSHRRVSNQDILSEDVTTFAEVMLDNGFVTAAFVDGGFMAPRWGLDQGFQKYVCRPGKKKGLAALGPRIKKWIEKNANEDFFLLIHTYDVHVSYDPPPPFRETFLKGISPSTPGFEPTAKTMKNLMDRGRIGQTNILTPEDIEYAKALYDGGIRYVDDWLETFVHDLDDLGLMDRATVVVVSDHGEEFQEHGSVLHEKLYSTVTRIPLIIRPPGGITGRRVDQVVESIDLMPTILEMVGLPPPDSGIEGQSLMPWFLAETFDSDVRTGTAFGESHFFGGQEFVIEGNHHLLRSISTGVVELYDFQTDLSEQVDLSSNNEDRVVSLEGLLHEWEPVGQVWDGQATDLDQETVEDLRALGYLE